jgi:hypothetical protein
MSSQLSFPEAAYARRHGPTGYRTYQAYKPWLRDEFTFRCVYCLLRETAHRDGHWLFGVEHLIPQRVDDTRVCDYQNLVYACNRCNTTRGRRSGVLDPCKAAYGEHLRICEDGRIEPLSTPGAVHIEVLELNEQALVSERLEWIEMVRQLQSPHCDPVWLQLMLPKIQFPDDLPDLSTLQPPDNTRPGGITASYYALRASGRLPETY